MAKFTQDFPPTEPNQVTLANWRKAPYCNWAFHHVREIVPSAEIQNDPANVWELENGFLDTSKMDLDETLIKTDTDALVILHDSKLVYETYRNGMTSRDPHILMSVSKSMLGLIAGTLVERNELSESDPITEFIPELANSAYAGATVRNLLDMRVGVFFNEDYLATEGPIIDYRYAANWNPVPKDREAGDLRSFMSSLTEADGSHGGRFHYVSPNTDLLAWVFERATGMRYADLVSERLWKPLGAEASGYITVDRIGGARAAGGKCFLARDLARVGMMMSNGGQCQGRQVISKQWINDIINNGDPQAWIDGDFFDDMGKREMHYRSKWYISREAQPLIFGLGIHGQFLFVDPIKQVSIAWFSSQNNPLNSPNFEKTYETVQKIRNEFS
jgi:CubicO group peptidase (beta-lactamase class C family)